MRSLTILLALGLASSDKLDRTYLPPPGAKSSDGNLGAVDVPLELPKEISSTTIRPRPKFPVRPDDTQITVGINPGQPSPTGAPQGFSQTTGPFASKYFPSSKPVYTPTTIPEAFVTTVSPVYGPNGDIISATPRPGFVNICEEGDTRCKQAQEVRPIYGPNGQVIGQQVTSTPGTVQGLRPVYGQNGEIIGVTPSPGTVEVTPTPGSVRGLRPVYGQNGEVIGVTPTPGTVAVTPTQGSVQSIRPVYGENGEVIGITPSPGTLEVTPTPGSVQGLRPVNGQNGEVIGVMPTPGTVAVIPTQGLDQSIHPINGRNKEVTVVTPSPEIVKVTATPGSVQGLRPFYGQNGEIIGGTHTLGNVQAQQNVPIYGPNGKVVDYKLSITSTPETVEVCKEGNVSCQKSAQQNVPIYGSTGQIVGYQPNIKPQIVPVYGTNGQIIGYKPSVIPKTGIDQILQTPGNIQLCNENDVQCQKQGYSPQGQIVAYQPSGAPTLTSEQGSQPVYGYNGQAFGATPTPGTEKGQKIVPVYGNDSQFLGYKPSVVPTIGTFQELQPIYSSNGQIIGQKPTTSTVKICNEGDIQCQKKAQQNIPVFGPSGQIFGYQPSVTPTLETSQSPDLQTQQIVPVYDSSRQVTGYESSITTTPGIIQGLQPVHGPSELMQTQQIVPVYGPSGQIVGYQSSLIPAIGTIQGPGSQVRQIIPVYDSSGQILDYQPSVTSTSETIQNVQPVYGPSSQITGQQPTSTKVQVCREGDVQCQKKALQNVPVYEPSGQIIGYQPNVTPGLVQELQPVYDSNGKIIGQRPSGLVHGCKEGDVHCQKKSLQNIPVYGPSGQIVDYQSNVTPALVQEFQPVYDSNGKIIGQRPLGVVQGCKEGDVQCQKKALQNVPVYGPSRQIIGYQPNVTPGLVQDLQPVYDSNGKIIGQQPAGLVQGCKEGNVHCLKKSLQNIPVHRPSGQIVGYQPNVIPGFVQELQPVYESDGKRMGQRPEGLVQGCKEGDVQCQKKSLQNIPVYGPSGQIVGYQPNVTPGLVQKLQPVYDSNGKIIGQRPAELIKECKEGDVQCQKQVQQIRPVFGPDGQIIGQQVTPTPGTVPSLQPVYGPNGQNIDQQTTVVSPTTGKPIYGGNKNIYLPTSTVKPSLTTPGYLQPSLIGTTPTPLIKYSTTPAPTGSNSERPLAESDKKAVTINYNTVITPDGYSYNFDTSNGIHVDETGIVKDGNKAAGTYSYIGDDGKEYKVAYKADENGFQATGDHLPTPHPIPADIQRVIEYAARDKQAGISDDGSYDEAKYGHGRYDQPNRPQFEDRQSPPTIGRKPFKPSQDKNVEQEEGYQYTPPNSKFPPRLPGRGQIKKTQGKYEEKSTTPNVNRGDEENYVPGASKSRPSGGQESSYTTYRPTGTNQPSQEDKYGRPVPSRAGQRIGTTTYIPSVSTQGQEDKFGKPITAQPVQEPVEIVKVDKYGRPISFQGYSTSTYIPVTTTEPSQADKFGRPIYLQPGETPTETAESAEVDEYGKTTPSGRGPGIGSSMYGPTISGRPTQEDKFGRPIYSKPEKESSGTAEQVDEYGRPTSSRPKQGIDGTTYRPTVKGPHTQIDKFGRPVYSKPEEETIGKVDKHGRLIPSRPEQGYSPTTSKPGETTEGLSSTTYRPTVKGRPTQVDEFGRPVYSRPGEETIGTPEPIQVDKYGTLIPARPDQGYRPTTSKPGESTDSGLLDAFGRPIYSTPESVQPGQIDEYARQIPERPEGTSIYSYRPVYLTQEPGYQSGSGTPGQKPEEFGPHEKQGPAYLSPYEDKTEELIGEDFRGPKQPPRFDPKTGYHY